MESCGRAWEYRIGALKGCTVSVMFLLLLGGCATAPLPRPAMATDRREEPRQAAAPSVAPSAGQAAADKRVEALVDLLKKKNLISAVEASQLLKEYGAPAAEARIAAAAPEIRLQEQAERIKATLTGDLNEDIQEQVRLRIQEEIPKEIKRLDLKAPIPEWMRKVRFGGDVRLRHQTDRYDENNALLAKADGSGQMNTRIDQDRFRYRVRVGAAVKVSEQVEATVRLATGTTSNPVSTNTTFGDYMNKDAILIDQAYLKWQATDTLSLYGGRMPNPWFSSDLVWDNDLNFEGIAANWKKPVTEAWSPFFTVGAFPLQQSDFSQKGKWLMGGQIGAERKRPQGISAKLGVAYYSFRNITGIANSPGTTDNNWTAPLYQQKGNSLFFIDTAGTKPALAAEFKELNITGSLDIGFWDPIHVVLLGDYVRNLGFDRVEVAKRTGVSNPLEDVTGYQLGISLGHPAIQEFGQWRTSLSYKYLGADAVVDAFTDSDFHLGGTDCKGWIFGGDLGLTTNVWLSARWMTANEIHRDPLAIDVLQLDLNARF